VKDKCLRKRVKSVGSATDDQYTQLFGCEMGEYPLCYLGMPMHHNKISNVVLKIIEDKFEKILSCSKGKLLSYGGRLVLINFVLSSLALFMLSLKYLKAFFTSWTSIDPNFLLMEVLRRYRESHHLWYVRG
jgi:hypothetical protein